MRTYREDSTFDPHDRPTWVDGLDNPYLHGPYTPVISEITAVDLPVVSGEIPEDLLRCLHAQRPESRSGAQRHVSLVRR